MALTMLMIQSGKTYVTIKRTRINRKFISQNKIRSNKTLPQPERFGIYQ